MCGRFAFYSRTKPSSGCSAADDTPEIEPRYNIAPTMFVPGPCARRRSAATRRLAHAVLGLVPLGEGQVGRARMINARCETLREKTAYTEAYRRRRALVAADGYYEWMKLGADVKQPYFIQPASGAPFAFGALWERWRDPATGEPLESCALITARRDAADCAHTRSHAADHSRRAPRGVAGSGQRRPGRIDRLLDPANIGPLDVRPVSRRVGNARNEGPDLIDPVEPLRPPPTPGDLLL
jgi:putative SOS response-associated peptidase YedK